jgi:hypothetical protein
VNDVEALRDWLDQNTRWRTEGDYVWVEQESLLTALAGYISPTQAAKDRAEAQAAGWEEALQAVAWCLRNGASSIEEILAYVGGNNPYRADRISGE